MDDEIEKCENLTVAQIFEKKGEDYFRKMEEEMLTILAMKIDKSNEYLDNKKSNRVINDILNAWFNIRKESF